MNKIELKQRTKKFTIDIIKFAETLPSSRALNITVNQLLRSASSVGANYRAACRGKSMADFINKIVIVEEEADESMFWLEIIRDAELTHSDKLNLLINEANELTSIFTAIGKTAKENQRSAKAGQSKNN